MRALGEPTEITIHHSASPLKTTVADIRRWHVEEREWADIGYHYVITSDGKIHTGRPIRYQGAHCPPNAGRIGICVVGNNTSKLSRWKHGQVHALEYLAVALTTIFPTIKLVHGHRDTGAATECPGCDIEWDGLLTVRMP